MGENCHHLSPWLSIIQKNDRKLQQTLGAAETNIAKKIALNNTNIIMCAEQKNLHNFTVKHFELKRGKNIIGLSHGQ